MAPQTSMSTMTIHMTGKAHGFPGANNRISGLGSARFGRGSFSGVCINPAVQHQILDLVFMRGSIASQPGVSLRFSGGTRGSESGFDKPADVIEVSNAHPTSL